MRKLLTIATIAMGLAMGSAMAQDSGPFVSYSDALTKCSADWKASDTRKNTPKGQGVAAWNEFRRDCVVKQGYVKGRKAPAQTAQQTGE